MSLVLCWLWLCFLFLVLFCLRLVLVVLLGVTRGSSIFCSSQHANKHVERPGESQEASEGKKNVVWHFDGIYWMYKFLLMLSFAALFSEEDDV